MAKTKDLFLNIAANPNMTLEDLASVGLTSENTMLLDRAQYASNEKVQDLFRDEEGNFDEQKFNTFYDIAEQSYNILANDEANLNLMNVTAYDSDNIFVDPSKRKQENKPYVVKLPNPDRLNVGVTRIGKIGPRTLSQDEIAQTQQVLLNPTEVANGASPIYGSAPNESWFEDFWDTRVMAAGDEDGTHIDPVTGKETQHKKGDLKLNENGTYYYESLDGRSVYGKRVLNKFNTLTTDGSAWNKYDFFDSDSIEQKSIGGSVLKNLALVGSMFIPYVGWGVAAASVAHQSAGLFATLGKMLAGSDSPTLDAIEGWVKSTDRRNLKTEYAQQNMWCWENFIDLIGDTTAQLREQRAIFKFAPALIKGDFKALSDKAMKEYGEKLVKESMENVTNKSFNDLARIAAKQNPKNWKEQLTYLIGETKGVFSAKADKAVRDYLQSYYKLGEPIAKAYMTAITVQDTFGEAIQAGASDSEATLLTLGYAAAEAALLSTDLGKWIMPELRTERQRYKMIAKKLLELPEETREMSKKVGRLEGETKKEWAKRLFNIGKDIANAEYSMLPKTVGNVLASGLGEGVEEVSEEALADFSKSCFNLVQQLQGDDVRMNAWNHNWDWSEAANRYGMSFAGGIMGGSINAAASDYKANREILNMNSQQAMQQLVYMTRNNELDDFWKVVNKTTLASKELSTQVNDNGTGYKPGTKDDNQDLAAKKALKKQIDLINSIINAENAKLDDSGLLSALIKADPSLKELDPVKEYRMRALSNSATAGRFLNEWNTVTSDIVKNRMEQLNITAKYGDKNSEKMSEDDNQRLKSLQSDLKVLQERKDAMLDGQRTREYVRDALFEMTHSVNELFNKLATEVQYAEAKTGKKYKDLSEAEKTDLHNKYEAFKNSNQYAEKIHELADIYEVMAINASQGIQASSEFYEQVKQNNYQNITALNNLVKYRLNALKQLTKEGDQGLNAIQMVMNNNYQDDLVAFNNDQALVQNIENIENIAQANINAVYNGRSDEELTLQDKNKIAKIQNNKNADIKIAIVDSIYDKINAVYDEALQIGFIHPETRELLSNMYSTLAGYANEGILKNELDNDAVAERYEQRMNELDAKAEQIKSLSNTPIVENLRQFQLSTNTDKTVVDLIEFLIKKEQDEKKEISTFQLDQVTLDQFKEARKLIEMYRSAIVGARFDNVDLDNIVGFNTTLNEISGTNETPKLAEIDAQTADLILEDINKVLARLSYAEGLHKLNTGNKYNVQNKTALNKQFILFNKIRNFISILDEDDDDLWKDKEGVTSRQELEAAINAASTLKGASGYKQNYQARNFILSPEEKALVEKESINVQKALHKYLNDRLDGSDASIEKLAKLLSYDNFKGLIRENDDFLEATSEDIDDSAFIWWLCATAALNPDDFYNNYRSILGEQADDEKPIAPIPTQELGVFALTAAITNGDMFKTFGKALRKSLLNTWESDESTRDKIREAYGNDLLTEDRKDYFKNVDFLPNFDNIIFVEGIAGSGKSTGVLKTLGKVLAKTNPEFVSQKILIAHTSQTKAENLGKSTAFTNFEAHDHDSLLRWMSSDYSPRPLEDGVYKYKINEDVKLVDGILRSNWEIQKYNKNEVPKLLIIDEWSHYNQLEQELIQRFAQHYGITVITMGDYDQLTPHAEIVDENGDFLLDITPHRNTTPRVAKLGVSMRTDNEVKNGNIYRMLAWKKNPTNVALELHYYEDENGIYGDKQYSVSDTYGDQLEKIKLDVKKMVSTLKNDEKIGYIYHSENSELYKWLTSTEGIKEHIDKYEEKDAHGREAQYYIVENNREEAQDALEYFSSVYTGITRSEQGSIVITNPSFVKKSGSRMNVKFNENGISFKAVQDQEMLPNTFTDEGTKEFTRKRKEVLDGIFADREVTPFNIKPRSTEEVVLAADVDRDEDSSLEDPEDSSTPEPSSESSTTEENKPEESEETKPEPPKKKEAVTPSTEEEPSELPPPPADYDYSKIDLTERKPEPSLEEMGGTRTPGDSDPSELFTEPTDTWQGPLSKNQKLYDINGHLYGIITGEDIARDAYNIYQPEKDVTVKRPKDYIQKDFYLNRPQANPIYNVGDVITWWDGTSLTIESVQLGEYQGNQLDWLYNLSNGAKAHEEGLLFEVEKGIITKVEPSTSEMKVKPSAYATEGQKEYEEAANEQFEDEQPSSVSAIPGSKDIRFRLLGFTFNNQYYADEFDDQDNLIPTNDDRIDNGYGLYKMNPSNFASKTNIREALGDIRKHLQYKSNQEILDLIQEKTDVYGLTMKWAFVSKANVEHRNGKHSRFNAPHAQLDYMWKEDSDVPLKTISAIIYDKNHNPVLELPIITFQSPHSIFRELKNKGIGQDIVNAWDFGEKTEKQTYQLLKNILNIINTNHKNDKGYQDLGKLIKLWLFTNNGFKLLPKDWNLHDSNLNLGNFYITERYSDSIREHDFRAEWKEIPDLLRSDRFVSSILMNNTDKAIDPVSNKPVSVFRPYDPYILISDSPDITNDQQAVRQYLRQQADPTLEPIVKAIPVSEPEVSVTNYIQSMYRLIKGKSRNEPYGNAYSPYRIWSAILKSPNADAIMHNLKPEERQLVKNYVQGLDAIKQKNHIKNGESKLAYKRRIAKLQNKYHKDNKNEVFPKLRHALVQSCFYQKFGIDDDKGDMNILQMIEDACTTANITGVLCHPSFESNQQGKGIQGFAFYVKVDPQNKYKFPGHGYFRAFGKLDTPTYDLSNTMNELTKWADDAHQGIHRPDPENPKQMKYYPNIWEFAHDDAQNWYLPPVNQYNINPWEVINKCSDLFARLGMNEYNIDAFELEHCSTESEAILEVVKMVNEEYIKTPGSFYIWDGKKYKYGNIITDQTPEFENLLFEPSTDSNQPQNVLKFIDSTNGNEVFVEIDTNTNDNTFEVQPQSNGSSNTPSQDFKAIKEEVTEKLNNSVFGKNDKNKQTIQDILDCYKDDSIDFVTLEQILNSGRIPRLAINNFRKTLKLDEIQQDVCVNPIKISFK